MLDLDIERFWKDDELAHKENCFSKEAPQVALGIRMSDECVFAELGEEGDYAAVKAMAEARRDERIRLMARHQAVKDHYQQPWNLRNHSIFMVFYEDLIAYIEKTPREEIKLDFFDMRHLASERFFWLR